MGDPVPHTSTSGLSMVRASWNLRISAGRTWLELRSKLSPGPYRLVGIAEMKLEPY